MAQLANQAAMNSTGGGNPAEVTKLKQDLASKDKILKEKENIL